ncbi:MAG: hypothetical protein RI894_2061 [Bacteroidota bacterium]|jgi:hypothetical protein
MNTINLTTPIANIYAALGQYEAIDLVDLDQVQLLNRIDTKFVMHLDQLADLFREVKDDYYALEIDNKRAFNYESLYFDTDDFQLYKQHHNGKLNRIKARYRRYSDSGLCFFEVKYKVKGGLRTDKKRLKLPTIEEKLSQKELDLVFHPQLNNADLKAKLWVYFTRITLASRSFNERLTIDININFDNKRAQIGYPELVIVEVKTEKSCYNSPIVKALKARHLEQVGFSKYSSGIALLENVKSNLFKPNFIKINKLLHAIY